MKPVGPHARIIRRGPPIGAAVLVAWALLAASSGAHRARYRAAAAGGQAPACPLKPSSAIPPGEAWAFTASGLPHSAHPGISSSYVHGRGTWTGQRGGGTICMQLTPLSGPGRELVLAVSGSARVSPGVTRAGRPGVALGLHVRVTLSNDPACAPGAGGSVALFASYYQEHHDTLVFSLAGGCGAYDYAYQGPALRVLIARDGRQVNSP